MAIKPVLKHTFYKNDGTRNAGGKVWTYEAGTTTPKATYTTSAATVENTNPIILDSHGECEFWTDGQYKVNNLESDDTQVTGWPVDNVGSGVSNNDANARWAGTATGSANALTISPSPAISAYVIGQSFIFKSGAAPNSGATTISISGLSTIAVQSNGAACSGGEILADKWYQIVLSSLTVCQVSKIGEPTLAELGAAALAGSASQTFSGAAAADAAHFVRADQVVGVLSAQSMIRLNTANGYGSTATKRRRFTNTVVSQGTDITYADSAADGATFTINTDGVYAISYSDVISDGATFAVTLNDNQGTTNAGSTTIANVLASATVAGTNKNSCVAVSCYFTVGSVINCKGDGVTGSGFVQFTITRVS